MKKTKIVCTLGPASNHETTIEKMLLAGMNVARINFSHGEHKDHEATIQKFRRVRDKLQLPAAVLLDTKGPEIRLGDFSHGRETLKKGQAFTLTTKAVSGNEEQCSVTYKKLPAQIKSGTMILIDDGRISMRAETISDTDIRCKVVQGGEISSRKGVNIPKIHLNLEYLSDADKEDLLFGIRQDVDYVAASFVRCRQDIIDLRSFLNANGGENIKVISKIENMEGIENFKEILSSSDGIMVARGDMGVEVNYTRLPGIQKKLIKACCQAGKIAITATQMLESMVENKTPTRAEITDVANAVFDGTSAIMLSAESAVGKYPAETVKVMAKIARQAERDAYDVHSYDIIHYEMDSKDYSNAIGHAACTTAKDLKAKLILAITISGHTARMMSKFKPKQPIIAATPGKKVFHQLALTWGVHPLLTQYEDNWDILINQAFDGIKQISAAKSGDTIVLSAGMPLQIAGKTNLIRVETI